MERKKDLYVRVGEVAAREYAYHSAWHVIYFMSSVYVSLLYVGVVWVFPWNLRVSALVWLSGVLSPWTQFFMLLVNVVVLTGVLKPRGLIRWEPYGPNEEEDPDRVWFARSLGVGCFFLCFFQVVFCLVRVFGTVRCSEDAESSSCLFSNRYYEWLVTSLGILTMVFDFFLFKAALDMVNGFQPMSIGLGAPLPNSSTPSGGTRSPIPAERKKDLYVRVDEVAMRDYAYHSAWHVIYFMSTVYVSFLYVGVVWGFVWKSGATVWVWLSGILSPWAQVLMLLVNVVVLTGVLNPRGLIRWEPRESDEEEDPDRVWFARSLGVGCFFVCVFQVVFCLLRFFATVRCSEDAASSSCLFSNRYYEWLATLLLFLTTVFDFFLFKAVLDMVNGFQPMYLGLGASLVATEGPVFPKTDRTGYLQHRKSLHGGELP